MSRVRVVRGKYTKISKENYNLSAEGSIKTFANGQIIENGKEKGVVFGNYQRLGSDVNDDFDIKFSLRKKDYETIVPMGILDYRGKYENALFAFDYTLSKSNVEKIKFEIIDENGEVIFSETTLPEIIISVNKREKIKNKLGNTLEKCLKDSNYSIKTWCWKDIYKEESIPSDDKTKIGSYIIFWDGFDHNDIYDSTRFNNKTLKARLTAEKLGKEKSVEIEIKPKYSKVDWIDVIIDKRNKKIDATLRVNLRDGGAEGVECSTDDIDPDPKIRVEQTECPWDKIPKEVIDRYKKEPIKSRTKTYEELRTMALAGIDKYWSRHADNIGEGVQIGEDFYQVFVKARYDKSGMKAPKIIYQTNTLPGRSRNWEMSRILFFYEGYLYKGNKWIYENANIDDFQMVSAHEIGHEILLMFGGHIHSKTHKGTSHWSMVIQNPDEDAAYIPMVGEIDLMKYYLNYYDISRTISSEKDVLGLLWLSKIKIR